MGGDDDKGGLHELGFETTAFEDLERDFQEVLTELVGDKSLEKFRKEYEKLHKALKKSHDQEKKLIKRCRELNSEIVNNAAKVQTALKLSQDDKHNIASLRREIDKAWKMVDASHDKEARAKETIQRLKVEIASLSRLVEQGAGLSVGQDNTVQELLKLKEDLTTENKEKENSLAQMREHQNELNGRIQELEGDLGERNRAIKELKDDLMQKNADQEREMRRKERLDKELKDLKKQLETKQVALDKATVELDGARTEIKRQQAKVKDAGERQKKHAQSLDELYGKVSKLVEERDKAEALQRETLKTLHNVEVLSKRKDLTIAGLQNDIQNKNRKVDAYKKSIESGRKKAEGLRKDKMELGAEINRTRKLVDDGIRREEEHIKKQDSLGRQIEIKEKAVVKESERAKGIQEEVEMLKRQMLRLETEKDRQCMFFFFFFLFCCSSWEAFMGLGLRQCFGFGWRGSELLFLRYVYFYFFVFFVSFRSLLSVLSHA